MSVVADDPVLFKGTRDLLERSIMLCFLSAPGSALKTIATVSDCPLERMFKVPGRKRGVTTPDNIGHSDRGTEHDGLDPRIFTSIQ